mmetsp:Transcript_79120/g.229821  ORF Transcript_79120/g.229821 Transcript_79120/m.229821 type:complete len:207 (-) Transcript_79120:2816-3436(-)
MDGLVHVLQRPFRAELRRELFSDGPLLADVWGEDGDLALVHAVEDQVLGQAAREGHLVQVDLGRPRRNRGALLRDRVVDPEHGLGHACDLGVPPHTIVVLDPLVEVAHQVAHARPHAQLRDELGALAAKEYESLEEGDVEPVVLAEAVRIQLRSQLLVVSDQDHLLQQWGGQASHQLALQQLPGLLDHHQARGHPPQQVAIQGCKG